MLIKFTCVWDSSNVISFNSLLGKTQFEIVPPTQTNKLWSLRIKASLERDILSPDEAPKKFVGEYANITVKCIMVDPQGTKRELSKKLPIEIIDEDDNVPVLQEPNVHVYLSGNSVHKVCEIIELNCFV